MIRNIVFDIGNVLTDFRWKDFLRDKGFDGPMIERISKASVESPYWMEIDRGEWDTEEIMLAFVRQDPEIEEELRTAFGEVHGMVTRRDYAIPWIEELKEKGYRVYYLSNFSYKAQVECADALDFLTHMDGGILSYQEKLIKPDEKIYQLLLGRYDLKAEETVFMDDLPANVEAAKSLGIRGIVFESKQQAESELAKFGVV